MPEAHLLVTLTLEVPYLAPLRCAQAARALESLVGVASAWVDAERGVASVVFDPASVNLDDIQAELTFEAVWSPLG